MLSYSNMETSQPQDVDPEERDPNNEALEMASHGHTGKDVLAEIFNPASLPKQYRLGVHLTDRKVYPEDEDLLEFLWNDGVDTPCMICDSPFEDEPPLRTMSLDSIFSENGTFTVSIRIHNRHFGCTTENKLEYIPISHVWHQSIALAHDNHEPTMEATRDVRDTVIRVLLAVTAHYGSRREIWHDYISIPQWRSSLQQQLLQKLWHIYAYPDFIILHLHDAESHWFDEMQDPNPMETIVQGATNLTACRWFERMWVVLEHVASQSAFALTRDWRITATPLKVLVESPLIKATKNYREFDPAKIFNAFYQLVTVTRNPDCLGQALDLIATKDCRAYRDRFTAAQGLLYAENSTTEQMPSGQYEACHWLATKRLSEGDYSPLLLIPVPEEERTSPSWLTAHSFMDLDTWSLGSETKPPIFPEIIRDGRVEPELELLGQILETKDMERTLPILEQILDEVVSLSGSDPLVLVRTLGSIYPPIYTAESFDVPAQTLLHVRECLQRYQNAKGVQDLVVCARTCDEICGLLKLKEERDPGVKISARLEWMVYPREGICKIKCAMCALVYLIRLHIWTLPGASAFVYRIPELSYAYSLPNGVGLVIEDHKIIGRMCYGVRACDCYQTERVLIV